VRVLFVTNMYPTAGDPGFGSFVAEQAADLRRAGVAVDICSFDGRTRRREYAAAFGYVRRAAASARYDVVHAHYGLSGVPALAQCRAPVVTTFHGSETGYVAWQRYVSWVVARRCTPIFVSMHNARALGLPLAPVIPAGVDLSVFTPRSPAEVRRELGWDDSAMYIVFPGSRANPRKRYDRFCETLGVFGHHAERVVGVPLEGLSRHQVAQVFQAADATLMTSDWEGSPVAVKESLACCTAVVSVAVGDVPEMLEGLDGCGIGPADPVTLAHLLEGAVRAKGAAALRSRACRYDGLEMARRIIKVYESAVGPGRSGADSTRTPS
jgi:teichuronic acid biosynthesis glycosyltransferase TuaC